MVKRQSIRDAKCTYGNLSTHINVFINATHKIFEFVWSTVIIIDPHEGTLCTRTKSCDHENHSEAIPWEKQK